MSVQLRSAHESATRATFNERLATALDRWAAGDRRAYNRHVAVYLVLVGVTAVVLSWPLVERAPMLRLVALSLFAGHVVTNKAIVASLTWLRQRGMPEAGRALDAYVGSGRLTNLEIGLIWVGFAVFAPLVDLVASTNAFAG